jgi:thioredoxin-like negative regulator of GroEL
MSSLRLVAAALLATVTAARAQAAENYRPFEPAAFAAAQAQNLPILLDVHAWWCPVCASQARTLRTIVASGKHPHLIIFRIDYDKQKDVWRGFGVQKQATLIAFHGKAEVGRIAYMTDKTKIAGLAASTER